MSTQPSSSYAELAVSLRACLLATAGDCSLGQVLELVEEVHERAGVLLAVARHLEEEMLADLEAVVLRGWAGCAPAQVPDVVPPAWLEADGSEGWQR